MTLPLSNAPPLPRHKSRGELLRSGKFECESVAVARANHGRRIIDARKLDARVNERTARR